MPTCSSFGQSWHPSMETALPDGPRGRIIATALTLTLLAALWFGAAAPLIGCYQDRAEQLAQRQSLLRHMQDLVETLPALEHARPEAQAAPSALLQGTTDALAAAAMQSMVQGMAAASGVELASMETLPVDARGAYRRIGLRVSLAAPWPVLIGLLREAGQGQPRMLVDDLQLHAVQVEAGVAAVPVNASFTLLAFRAAPAGGGT
jgi:general secretion pathway protein M